MLEVLGYAFLVCVIGLAAVYVIGLYRKAKAFDRSVDEANEIVESYKLQMQVHQEAINWEDAQKLADEWFS